MSQLPNPFPDNFDPSTKHGALLLCNVIVAVWAKRGHKIKAERYQLWREGPWGVRSNLVQGLPPKRPGWV